MLILRIKYLQRYNEENVYFCNEIYIWYSKTCDDFCLANHRKESLTILYYTFSTMGINLIYWITLQCIKLHFHTNINFHLMKLTKKLCNFTTVVTIIMVIFSVYNLRYIGWNKYFTAKHIKKTEDRIIIKNIEPVKLQKTKIKMLT